MQRIILENSLLLTFLSTVLESKALYMLVMCYCVLLYIIIHFRAFAMVTALDRSGHIGLCNSHDKLIFSDRKSRIYLICNNSNQN